ncbi:431_t:CDS:2, partial [Rhizophagus irregularis]
MVKIFKQFDISSNSPDGLLRRVFLWVGCCTACRGGSYHSIMASHFKKHEPGTYGACHDIRKYLSLRPNNNAEETFFFVLIKILK